MGRKYYLDPVTKEKIYIRNTVSKPPVIDVQVDGESVLEDRIAKINLSDKQDTLVSGVNIKTINNESILGSGNIRIAGGAGGSVDVIKVNGVEQPNSDGVVNLEVPTKTSELINDSSFLTEHQDLSDYAKKSEIPDVSTYLTQEQLEAKDYANKAYVAEKVTEAVTGGQVDLSSYLKKTEAVETYVKKEAGKSLIADTEITRLASVTNYDDTSISNRIKTVEDNYSSLATVATTGSYNDLTDKPAIPDESTVSGWGFTKNTGTVTSVKINNASKNPVNGVIDLGTVITAHQDISGKQDTISDLATIRAGAAKGATALQSIPSEYITETELEAKGYLTSESDPIYTADKPNIALKSEIPTKTSQLTNDSGYITDISGKVDKVSGKGLSTNDLTDVLKSNYDTAYNHSQQVHAPSNAQANIIESVKVDGTVLTVTNKAVNIDLSGKVDKVSGKSLSANDLTNTLKSNYDTAYAHSQQAHAPSSAQANVIETIKVNGTAQTVTSKAVDIAVPTKTSQLTNDSGFKTTDNNTTYSLSKSGSTIILAGSDGSTTSVTDSNTTYGNATTSAAGLMSKEDKVKLDGIASGANNYTHPSSHPASMITQDATHRFVTDAEKNTWNAKASTKSDVGLGNVTNDAQVKRSEMGAASGVATLGSDGKVPSSQLPSYVDDVLEYNGMSSFPSAGESGKIYVDTATNKTYR